MKRSSFDTLSSPPATSAIAVRNSKIHGRGVFATRKIAAGTCVIEYQGERITARQAASRASADPDNPFHTFFFSLENGRLIDGASKGNDARWINHCCEPNCEAREEDGQIFIYALRDIKRGEELNYDYGLIVSERHTASVKRAYACLCGAPNCRKTMLAPKRKPGKQKD
jgi:SET domain-containing protein